MQRNDLLFVHMLSLHRIDFFSFITKYVKQKDARTHNFYNAKVSIRNAKKWPTPYSHGLHNRIIFLLVRNKKIQEYVILQKKIKLQSILL